MISLPTEPSPGRLAPLRGKRRECGAYLVEVCFALTISIFMGVSIVTSLVHSQRYATSARLLTNARAIVHRNIDASSGVVFTNSSIPTLLGITSTTGTVCDDDGVTTGGIPVENIQLSQSGTAVVTGTLTRIVTQQSVSESSGANVLRITYQIDYDYLSKHCTYAETTLRSVDSN